MSLKKKKYIFNISPTRVAGAISYFDEKEKKAIVEYLTEEKIELKKDFSLKDFRKSTLKAIDKVCLDFISRGKLVSDDFIIEEAEIFLTSPWVDYDNYSLNHESLTSFKMTDKFLDNFLIKRKTDSDRELISSDITSIRVNDYETDLLDLRGKEAQKLSISFFDATILKFDKYFIDGAIRNHFSLIKIKFNAFLPVLFYQIAKFYDIEDDFVFLDINNEITEFGIYRNNLIEKISYLPFGFNKIVNKILDEGLVESKYQAESLLKIYLNNDLGGEEKKKVKKIIDNFIKEFNLDRNELPSITFVFDSRFETKKILKGSGLFKNIYFINNQNFDSDVKFISNKFDNFIAAEVDYIYK